MQDNSKAPRKQDRATLKRWLTRGAVVSLAIGVLVAVVLAALPKPIPVQTATATRGPLVVNVDADGRTRVQNRYVVSAPLTGRLARITLRAGDRVEEGTVLARLLPLPSPLMDAQAQAQAQAQLAAARAAQQQAQSAETQSRTELKFAEAELKSAQALLASGSTTRKSVELAELNVSTKKQRRASARFGVRVARHEVALAAAGLKRSASGKAAEHANQVALDAPIAGVVLEVKQESEGVVQAGMPLLVIGDPQALEVVVDVLTSDAVRIKAGDQATITGWGGDQPLQGRVRLVEPRAFTHMSSLGVEEQRVNVVLDLTSAVAQRKTLGDGYRVEAHITIWQADDVLRAPASALFRRGDKWVLFVLAGETARLRTVELGQRTGDQAEVLSGLEAGELVILHPGERVVDGAKVTSGQP